MIVITDCRDTIIDIGASLTRADGGVMVNGVLYPDRLGLQAHSVDNVPDEIEPGKHLYRSGSFIPNPRYAKPITKDIEDIKRNQADELKSIKKAIDDLILGGVL